MLLRDLQERAREQEEQAAALQQERDDALAEKEKLRLEKVREGERR